MSDAPETCALCPRLCRPVCPVAVGSGREAAVPAVIGDVLLAWKRGQVEADLARAAATLCTGCGQCQQHCHLDVPLPAAIAGVWTELLPALEPEPVAPVEGDGRLVAVESDARAWGGVLAERLGEPVAVVRTADHLGAAALERGARGHLGAVRAAFRGRRVVVGDGGSARVLEAAGASWQWLHELLPELGEDVRRSCASGGQGCCGGAGPLEAFHESSAARVARAWGEGAVCDARCRSFLRRHKVVATDCVDRLLGAS